MAKSKKKFGLNEVKKYSIWVAIPLAVIIALVVAQMAVGAIEKKFEQTKNDLTSAKSGVESIINDKMQPNQKTINAIKDCTKSLSTKVLLAWSYLEEDQKIRNKWPSSLPSSVLEEIERLRPGDSIKETERLKYGLFVNGHLPEMLEKAEIRKKEIYVYDPELEEFIWTEADDVLTRLKSNTGRVIGGSNERSGGSGRLGGGMANLGGGSTRNASGSGVGGAEDVRKAEDERYVGKVDWLVPEIGRLVSWDQRPASIQVWYAQEDIWVYEALLSVITATNKSAKSRDDAPIKRIEGLLIGQQASVAFANLAGKTIGNLGGTSTTGDAGSSSGGSSTPDPGGNSSGTGGSMPSSPNDEEGWKTYILDNRYVGLDLKPLKVTDTPPFKEFNRMPVCLQLTVDQLRIPDILVNCANCAMPIDVLQVRINPSRGKQFNLSAFVASTSSSSSGSSSSDSGSYGGSGSYGSSPGGGSGSSVGSSGGGNDAQRKYAIGGSADEAGKDIFYVEIYGIINIFNESKHSILSERSVEEEITDEPEDYDLNESETVVSPEETEDTEI